MGLEALDNPMLQLSLVLVKGDAVVRQLYLTLSFYLPLCSGWCAGLPLVEEAWYEFLCKSTISILVGDIIFVEARAFTTSIAIEVMLRLCGDKQTSLVRHFY